MLDISFLRRYIFEFDTKFLTLFKNLTSYEFLNNT